jgi:hypothetical protein
MVGEARGEERQDKNSKYGNPLKSHKHIQLRASLPEGYTTRLTKNLCPRGKNIVKASEVSKKETGRLGEEASCQEKHLAGDREQAGAGN